MSVRSGSRWMIIGLLATGGAMAALAVEEAPVRDALPALEEAEVTATADGIMLRLSAGEDLTYDVFLLTEPDRVVLDLVGVAAPLAVERPEEQSFVSALRYSLWKQDPQERIVRYVIETSGAPEYRAATSPGELRLWVSAAGPGQPEQVATEEIRVPPGAMRPGPEPPPPAAEPVVAEPPVAEPVVAPPPVAADPLWGSLLVPQPGLWDAITAEGPGESWNAAPDRLTEYALVDWIDSDGCAHSWGEALVLDTPGESTAPPADEDKVVAGPALATVAEPDAPPPALPKSAEAPREMAPADLAVDEAAPVELQWAALVQDYLPQDSSSADTPLRLAAADELALGVAPVAWPAEGAEEVEEVEEAEEIAAPEQAAIERGDPFAAVIERYRAEAASRAARRWGASRPRHDPAPQLSGHVQSLPAGAGGNLPPMSLDVQGSQVHTVLRAIAEYAGVNIVADANVQGSVTLRALDLPWRDMLDAVCRSLALIALDNGAVIRVATAKSAQDEAVAHESAERRKEDFMPLETRVIAMNFANAGELVSVASTMRSQRGKAEVDDRTNSLVLTDIVPRLDLIEGMLHELDSQTMQVEITAEIVDVDVMEARNLGIAWGLENGHSSSLNMSGSGGLTADDVVGPAAEVQVGVLRSFGAVQAKIQALATANKADIISTPRITTVNNRMARILVGKEVPLITMDEAGNAITELKKVGITLEVTPYVNSETEITLDLHPEVSDLSSQSTVAGGVVFTTTEADTRVMVREGETAVIAGLIRTQHLQFERGVPLLKDVPVLGHLFRSTDSRDEKRELLIFVTPRIVRNAD